MRRVVSVCVSGLARRAFRSKVVILVFLVAACPRGAEAAFITVAEFRWETTLSSCGCDSNLDSTFVLTNLWLGPDPAVTLFDNVLSLPSGDEPFFDLDLFAEDRISVAGVPDFASVTVSFLFEGRLVTLGTTLRRPDTFDVLRFNPVPEPGTLALF